MRRLIWMAALTLASASTGSAEQIRVLSAGSLQRGLAAIGEAFKAETGHGITIEVGTTPVMTERLESGDMFDVVIATSELVEAAAARGQVDPRTSQLVGRVGIGIAVRDGVAIPQIQTVEELKAILLSADTVVYNRGSSGVYSQSMIESIGVGPEIAAKTTQYANAGQVITHVLGGEGTDLGLAPTTEIQANAPSGLRLVALPDAVQNYTAYHAVVARDAVGAAADFVRYLTTPSAQEAFAATGVD